MKRFQFSLETVLDFKQRTLDSIQVEYATALSRLRQQEEVLERARQRYMDTNQDFRDRKLSGLTIAGMMSYEVGLQVLEREIHRELMRVEQLKREASEVHERLIASKVDTSSIELLRDKKLKHYNHELQKQEERLIDDLFGPKSMDKAEQFL